MRKNFNIAVVGCGQISDSHIQAWKSVSCKIVAVCDKNVAFAKSKASRWGIPRYYEDVSKMLEEENLDVVSICTSANARLSVLRPIIEAGVNVVIEKPFATSVSEAEKILELQKKYGVKLSVVHNWLFSHIMRQTLFSLKNKKLGDIIGIEMNLLHTKNDYMVADSSHWCHTIEAGRFGEMLPHPIYLIRAILGDVHIKHVTGSKLGHYSWMPIDELRILLEDKTGRTASIYVSFNNSRQETTLKVFGNKGILDVNLSNNILVKRRYREFKDINITQVSVDNLRFLTDLTRSSFSIAYAILTKKYRNMHTEFIKAFLNSILNDTEPPVTAKEALEVVKLHSDLCSTVQKLYF